ncbi:MAG: amino acid racemase [Bdellovibrionales bacterium]|nr:amino acid racemase [Bdellovibrionales bacterium]
MKCLGLIGGVSWESTREYYRHLNTEIRARLGGLHSAHCLIYSVDFDPLERAMERGDWKRIEKTIVAAAQSLERGGAEALLLGSNTLHLLASEIKNKINLPLLHIADAVGNALLRESRAKALLLGTRLTMEQGFYQDYLSKNYPVRVVTPDEEDRKIIHKAIFEELCLGVLKDSTRHTFVRIIQKNLLQQIDSVILGCTEIENLLSQDHCSLPLFPTTALHVRAGIDWALN